MIVFCNKKREQALNQVLSDRRELTVEELRFLEASQLYEGTGVYLVTIHYLFVDNNVLRLTHPKTTCHKAGATTINAFHMYVVEILQASKTSEPLPTFRDFAVRIQCIEGLSMLICEPDAIILDFKANDLLQPVVQPPLGLSQCTNRNSTTHPARLFYGLDTIHDYLNNRRIDSSTRPNVVHGAPNVNTTHFAAVSSS